MLSLSQLLVLTQNDKRRFRSNYRVEALKLNSDADNFGAFLQFAAIVSGGKDPRRSLIRLYAEEVSATATAKVACSCPYFRIRLAVSLFLSGATDMKVDRSDIPEKLRGLQKLGLCPHLLTLAESLLSLNTTEMKRLRHQARHQNVHDRLRRLT